MKRMIACLAVLLLVCSMAPVAAAQETASDLAPAPDLPLAPARLADGSRTAGEYYVATDGSDDENDADGSLEHPFATLGKAASVMEAGDTCFVRGGTYREELSDGARALLGREGAPITFKAYAGEEVTISGGQLIEDGWTRHESADGANIWKAPMGWDVYGGAGNMVFVDGEAGVEGRWPNMKTSDFLDRDAYARTGQGTSGLSVKCDSLPKADLAGAQLWCASGVAYESIVFPVVAHDSLTGTLTLGPSGPGGSYNPAADNVFYVTRSLALVDAPGEWYKDTASGELYVCLPDGKEPGDVEIEAKRREYAINLSQSSHVVFEGIDVRGGIVSIAGESSGCTFTDATVEWLDACQGPATQTVNGAWQNGRGHARGIVLGGSGNRVVRCEIRNMHGEGVSVEGAGNYVVNNDIHDVNFEHSAFSEGVSMTGEGHLVSRNTVRRTGRGTIGGRYDACEISYNDLSDACRLSRDAGVVYFNAHDYRNTEFHHNLVHDSRNNEGMQSGIYLDSFTTSVIVHHNVVYGIEYDAFDAFTDPLTGRSVGWSRRSISMNPHSLHVVIANNTFVNTSPMDFYHYDKEPQADFSGMLIANNLFRSQMKWTSVIDLSSLGVTLANNLEGTQLSNEQYEFADFWKDSTNADEAKRDYMLADGSAAIDAGLAIPGIADGVTDGMPDCGAYEHGEEPWEAGCDLGCEIAGAREASGSVPRANQVANPGFEEYARRAGNSDFDLVAWEKSGSPRYVYNSAWEFWGEIAKDGSFALRLAEGDGLAQRVSGLKADTVYEVGGYGRVAGAFTAGNALVQALDGAGAELVPAPAPESGIGSARVLRYDGIDFGAGGMDRMLLGFRQLAAADVGLRVEVSLDGASADPVGAVAFSEAKGRPDIMWEWLSVDLEREVTGVHDVYVRLVDAGNVTFSGKYFGGFFLDSSAADDALVIHAAADGGDAVDVVCAERRYASPMASAFVKTGSDGAIDLSVSKAGSALYGYVDQISVAEAFPAPSTVTLPDAALYQAVVGQLEGKGVAFERDDAARTVSLYASEIGRVTSLDLSNSGIASLDGIEGFTALAELDVSNNRVSDLGPAAKLAYLKVLKARGNGLGNACLPVVGAMKTLTWLDLSRNELVDAEGKLTDCAVYQLRYLGSLKHLDLSHNQLRLLHGAFYLKNLEYLDVYDNYVHDLAGLAQYDAGSNAPTPALSKLAHLDLGENNETGSAEMAHLEALDGLAALEYLDFSENRTPGIVDHLGGMRALWFLQLQLNGLTDVSALSALGELKTLILCNNDIADIQPLLGLSELEELNLLSNKLTFTAAGSAETDALFGTVADGELVWTHLRKLDLNRNFQSADGAFQQPPELKAIYDLSATGEPGALELGYNYRNVPGFDTAGLLHEDVDGTKFTTYDDFGARCDGSYDDYIAIFNAHVFAERNWNCEVRATAGGSATGRTYHIFKPYDTNAANVLGNVDWQGATFVVHDEDIENKAGRFYRLFYTQETHSGDYRTIANPDWTIGTQTTELPQIADALAQVNAGGYKMQAPYGRFLCTAVNANKRQFIRSGEAGAQGNAQQDSFIVDSAGKLLDGIQWDFEAVTELSIVPIPDEQRFVRNATFVTEPVSSRSEAPYTRPGKQIYYHRNIYFGRCNNFAVSGIDHRIDADGLAGSYTGFLAFHNCADVDLHDCKLFAQKVNTQGRSAYDLNLDDCTDMRIAGVSHYGDLLDTSRWGVVGGNYLKDIVVERCKLNVFDAHSGVYNLTVRNCEIGNKGISVVGQGSLSVEGSTISSDRPIQLRGDYGSMWNGTAAVADCTWRPLGQYRGRMFAIDFAFTGENNDGGWWDYGYDRHFPDVTVENLTIDDGLNASQPDHDLLANGLWAFYSREVNVGKDPVDYWPASIAVNGFKFANASRLGEPRFHITTTDLGNIRERGGNYLVTDVTATTDGADVTRRLFAGERVEAEGPVSVSIAENATAANTVQVVRDGAVVQALTGVSGAWKRTFSDAGAYEVRIASKSAGLGWEGSRTLAFTVKAAPAPVRTSIAKAEVTLAKTTCTFTGKAIEPAVKSVVLGSEKLRPGTDYSTDYTYSGNVNAGTAKVTVKGQGSYKGSAVATFKIVSKKATPSVTLSKTTYVYNGSARTPNVTVKVGASRLEAADYTVSWPGGRKNVGTYTVKVKLKRNYTGSRAAVFKVLPKPTALSKLAAGKRALTATWKRQAVQTSGYQLQYSLKKGFKPAKTLTVAKPRAVSKKVAGLASKKRYYVRVRTYKKVGKVMYCSTWSKAKAVTTGK